MRRATATYNNLSVNTPITAENLAEYRGKYLEALSVLRRHGVALKMAIATWEKNDNDKEITKPVRDTATKLTTAYFREKLNSVVANRQSWVDWYRANVGLMYENMMEE